MSSGTLNPTVPYHTRQAFIHSVMFVLTRATQKLCVVNEVLVTNVNGSMVKPDTYLFYSLFLTFCLIPCSSWLLLTYLLTYPSVFDCVLNVSCRKLAVL